MAGAKRPFGWGRYLVFGLIAILAVTGGVTWAAFALLRPTPPRKVAMATGPEGSTSAALGLLYREFLAREGVSVRLVQTAGAVENAALLRDAKSGVSIAIIPGGITNQKESPELVSLGTLFYEPLWLFYRPRSREAQGNLQGLTISIGPEGSGSRALALEFFARARIIDQVSERLLPLSSSVASEKLLRGEIDGVVLLAGWDSPQVQMLLAARDLKLVSARRADAWVALYPFLNKVIVPAGVANMAENIPPEDVVLLAPKASLVVREDLHPAIQYLLMEAALEVHSEPGVFRKAAEFPAAESIDLPLGENAIQFYKTGRPFLQRHLPFWMAVLVQQLLVLLIPVVGVLYPLVRVTPEVFGWIIRRRVFSLYNDLTFLETEIDSGSDPERNRQEQLARLDLLEDRAVRFRVPVSFEPLVYDLRSHISMVRQRLLRS